MKRQMFTRVVPAWGLGMLLAGVAAAQDAEKDAKGDLAKLQGGWVGESGGKKVELKFDKDAFTLSRDDKSFKGTFKIDPSKKPREMDLAFVEGGRFAGKTGLGIYELDGDTLKWCFNRPGREGRPETFPDQEGEDGGRLYVIYKRAK